MSSSDFSQRLEGFARIQIGSYPTPLEQLPALSSLFAGPRLWIKRDDALGPAPGGNKTRNLEYLLADALKKGRGRVATFGSINSNHCRLTAAVCSTTNLEAHLFFFEPKPDVFEGNLLAAQSCDARMHFVPIGAGGDGSMTLEMTNRLVGLLSRIYCGPRVYFIPAGGHNAIGCMGYVRASLEIREQVRHLNLAEESVTVVTAAGTGGTLAGLLAGFALLDSPIKVLGIDIGRLWKAFPESIAMMVNRLGRQLGSVLDFAPEDIPLIEHKYVGKRYGEITTESRSAIELMASLEEIDLDPVYTGKAFFGLMNMIQGGRFGASDEIIFLHTGGAPEFWKL